MIVCGDFVYPMKSIRFPIECPSSFRVAPKVINFEGSLKLEDSISKSPIPLFSSKESLTVLKTLNCKVLTAANNHFHDFIKTKIALKKHMEYFDSSHLNIVGFGIDKLHASKPIYYGDYLILNFGWHVIGCKKSSIQDFGCNPLEYDHVIRSVTKAKCESNKKIVVIFHWGYEFEKFPLPAHRELAHKVASIGVHFILGHHAHLVQNYEIVKQVPIFYGLGNFYMPSWKFGNFELNYPKEASNGICVDISNKSQPLVYKARLTDNKLEVFKCNDYMKKENALFSGLSHKEYIFFFKANRLKKERFAGLHIHGPINAFFGSFSKN